MDVPAGRPKSNCIFEGGPEKPVTDVRGHESNSNLDDNGFMFKNHVFDMVEYDINTIEGKGGYLD